MTTDRLRAFLGCEYEVVVQHTVEQAFVESLAVVPGVASANLSPNTDPERKQDWKLNTASSEIQGGERFGSQRKLISHRMQRPTALPVSPRPGGK